MSGLLVTMNVWNRHNSPDTTACSINIPEPEAQVTIAATTAEQVAVNEIRNKTSVGSTAVASPRV